MNLLLTCSWLVQKHGATAAKLDTSRVETRLNEQVRYLGLSEGEQSCGGFQKDKIPRERAEDAGKSYLAVAPVRVYVFAPRQKDHSPCWNPSNVQCSHFL